MKKPRPTPKTSVGTHATTANPDGDQRKPPSFQRFEPRPPAFLGPGIETRHPYRSQSRRHDALLARQKRGVAAALLSHPRKQGLAACQGRYLWL